MLFRLFSALFAVVIPVVVFSQTSNCVNSFYKRYQGATFGDFSGIMVTTNDNHIIHGGYMVELGIGSTGGKITLTKFDDTGRVVISKKVVLNNADDAATAGNSKLKDGNFLISSTSSYQNSQTFKKLLLIKYNSELDTVWTKSYVLPSSCYGALNGCETSDGNIHVLVYYPNSVSVITFDATGNFVRMNNYAPSAGASYSSAKMIAADNNLYLTAYDQISKTTTVLKINGFDAKIIWSKTFTVPGIETRLIDDIEMMGDKLLLYGSTNHNSGSYNPIPLVWKVIVLVDSDGNLLKTKTLSSATTVINSTALTINKKNEVIVSGTFSGYQSSNVNRTFISILDANLVLQKTRAVPRPENPYPTRDIITNSSGSVYESGWVNGLVAPYPGQLFLRKNAADALQGSCSSYQADFIEQVEDIKITPVTFTTRPATVTANSVIISLQDYAIALTETYCKSVSNCSSLVLPDNIVTCTNQTITINGKKNEGCSEKVNWHFSNDAFTTVSNTDSSITFTPQKQGLFRLTGLIEGCATIIDSTLITVFDTPTAAFLGRDTTLCTGSSILLNAGAGYKDYLWQDGSNTSTYKVSSPGVYSVTITDNCDNILKDTIVISPDTPLSFDPGADKIRCTNDTITLSVPTGFTDYQWSPSYNLSSSTGNLVKAFPDHSTTYTVSAKKINGCVVSATIRVNTKYSPGRVELGRDTVLCKGDSITLRANPRYALYQWNFGSNDSLLVVKQAGTYRITVTDSCNNIYSDTIVVRYDNPSFNIGGDKTKCNNDSVFINAPDGFYNYRWTPSSTITSTKSQNVGVFPMKTTIYKAYAQTVYGCSVMDSVKVIVNTSPPVNLGPDTSFCSNDSIYLFAGNGFTDYKWITGSPQAGIIIKKAGSYSVIATATNGCSSYDTLVVSTTYALPDVNLGSDFPLCIGNEKRLEPGIFKSYIWQNGSTASSLVVNQKGTYWVTVTNNNNCSKTDTVEVTALLPVPANFLKAADSICQYDKIQLEPLRTYAQYNWSTGSIQKSITVEKPGNYRLSVTDTDGCIGADTINIFQKKCLLGAYIPTAFTPNNDRKNDVFKASVFGTVISFHLSVFNRLGQNLFSTSDPNRGWDGTINGTPANSGTYIYQCSVQIEGNAPVLEKGTVVLLR